MTDTRFCFGPRVAIEVSTRAGRRYAWPADGAEVVGVDRDRQGTMIAATTDARGPLCPVEDQLPGRPSRQASSLIKLGSDEDKVLGFIASTGDRDLLTVETTRGGSRPSAPRNTK